MKKILPPNKCYLQDLTYVKTFLPNILNALGVWPFFGKKKSTYKRLVDCSSILFLYSLIFATLIPATLFWVFKGNVRACLQMSPFFMYTIGTISKYGILIFGQDQIRRCWNYIEDDWKNAREDARGLMLESARVGRRLVAICGWFYCSCGVCLRVMPLFYSGKIQNRDNVTIKSRLLPNPAYLFSLNMQASPVYEIMYSLQGASGLINVLVATSAVGLIIVFVMHACGQLKILMNLMKEFTLEKHRKEVDKKLADIVEHQIRIRSFLQLVEHTMHQIGLLEIMAASLVTCVAGYFMITEWKERNSMAMILYSVSSAAGIINMFIFCYTGNQLILQAEEVALICSELEWYRLPDRKARQIVLLMIMSNKPIKITAGKFIDVSLKTFGEIIKTTLAYLNMLRTVIA